MSGATGLRFTFASSSSSREPLPSHDLMSPGGTDAPFFARIKTVEELQKCKQDVEALQTRVNDLERINSDLEHRLEEQAKQSMLVEKECISLERKWRAKCELLEKDTDTWKREYEEEKRKSEKLREHLSRTERELYSIIQRKHELMRTGGQGANRSNGLGPGGGGGGGGGGGVGGGGAINGLKRDLAGVGGANGSSERLSGLRRSESSHSNSVEQINDLFTNRQAKAPQEIRQRRMMASLSDFLGI